MEWQELCQKNIAIEAACVDLQNHIDQLKLEAKELYVHSTPPVSVTLCWWVVTEYFLTGECPWKTTLEQIHKHHEGFKVLFFICHPVKSDTRRKSLPSLWLKVCCLRIQMWQGRSYGASMR
jgi:hypothetical protein